MSKAETSTVGGGAVGVIFVWIIPQVTSLTIGSTESAALVLAFSAVVRFVVSYLPEPNKPE